QKLRTVPDDVGEVVREMRRPCGPRGAVRRNDDGPGPPDGDVVSSARRDALERVALRQRIDPPPGSAALPENVRRRQEEKEEEGERSESKQPRHGNLA